MLELKHGIPKVKAVCLYCPKNNQRAQSRDFPDCKHETYLIYTIYREILLSIHATYPWASRALLEGLLEHLKKGRCVMGGWWWGRWSRNRKQKGETMKMHENGAKRAWGEVSVVFVCRQIRESCWFINVDVLRNAHIRNFFKWEPWTRPGKRARHPE